MKSSSKIMPAKHKPSIVNSITDVNKKKTTIVPGSDKRLTKIMVISNFFIINNIYLSKEKKPSQK